MFDEETDKTGALSQEEIDQLLSGVEKGVDMVSKAAWGLFFGVKG